MLLEWAKQKQSALVPASRATAPLTSSAPAVSSPVSNPPVSAPPVFSPLATPLMSAHTVHAPLVLTANSEWKIPVETLRLFPVETPFFPMTTERGSSSSRVGKDESDVDLSVFRDDYRPKKPGDMDWSTLARANAIHHHHHGDEDGVNLDMSL